MILSQCCVWFTRSPFSRIWSYLLNYWEIRNCELESLTF